MRPNFDDARPRRFAAHAVLRDLARDESGMFTAVNCLAILFIAVLMAMLLNVGHIVHRKVKLQNAADAVAYSSAVWQARGMNAITMTNHVIGELTAFLILHEAIGGRRLDDPSLGPADTHEEDSDLDRAYQILRHVRGPESMPAYKTVREKRGVMAGATLLEAKKRLKRKLTWVYHNKIAAVAMQESHILVIHQAGVLLEQLMDIYELLVLYEYQILDALHEAARALLPAKQLIRDVMLPSAKQYTLDVADSIPRLAQATAEEVGRLNDVRGTAFPHAPKLPVVVDPLAKAMTPPVYLPHQVVASPEACPCESEPADNMRYQIVKVTQLARASFPWVNYHREPVVRVLDDLCPISDAGEIYFGETNGQSRTVCDRLQRLADMGLLVMRDYPAPDKGYAQWSEKPELADELFGTLGLAYEEPPAIMGIRATFFQAHPRGQVAIAQAMLYNANDHQRPVHRIDLGCKRITPIRQANVGWDTLNWEPGQRNKVDHCSADQLNRDADDDEQENRPFELVGIGIPSEYPEIQLNWQARLVPVSAKRLADLRRAATGESPRFGAVASPFREVVSRLLPVIPSVLRLH